MKDNMRFALFDTETTGLPFHFRSEVIKQPRVIEFAGIITDGNEILHQFEMAFNPQIAIEEIITKITGFTNKDLEDKPDFSVAVPQLKAFFEKADAAVSHNLSFDKSMLKYDLERRELTLEDISWPSLELCTVEQTMPFYGKRMKLQDLYALLCGEQVQKHRAMDDVLMLHDVCKSIGLYSSINKVAV